MRNSLPGFIVLLSVQLISILISPGLSLAAEKEDVIYLNDGTVIRGLILSHVAGKSYTIIDYEGVKHEIESKYIKKVTKESKSEDIPLRESSPENRNGITIIPKIGYFAHMSPVRAEGGYFSFGFDFGYLTDKIFIGGELDFGSGNGTYGKINNILVNTRYLFLPEANYAPYGLLEIGYMSMPGYSNSGLVAGGAVGFDKRFSETVGFCAEVGYRGFSATTYSGSDWYGWTVSRKWWSTFGFHIGIILNFPAGKPKETKG